MMTVAILINGRPIISRSVRRIKNPEGLDKRAIYSLDDGKILLHNPDDGAVVLAKMILNTMVDG